VRTTLVSLAVALAATPFLVACGSKGSASSTLTTAEWRQNVNEICRDVGRRVRAVQPPTKETEILPFTATVIPLWKSEEERIRALSPPAELVDPAEELADALSEVNLSLLEIHISTQRNDEVRRFDAIKRRDTAARAVKLRSRALGLPDCAKQRVP
jgi:hypothetical protein